MWLLTKLHFRYFQSFSIEDEPKPVVPAEKAPIEAPKQPTKNIESEPKEKAHESKEEVCLKECSEKCLVQKGITMDKMLSCLKDCKCPEEKAMQLLQSKIIIFK